MVDEAQLDRAIVALRAMSANSIRAIEDMLPILYPDSPDFDRRVGLESVSELLADHLCGVPFPRRKREAEFSSTKYSIPPSSLSDFRH